MTEPEKTETQSEDKTPENNPDLPSCKCGFTRNDLGQTPYVEAKGEWGAWGWFYLLIGITAVPKIVRFQCHKCSVIFDQTTDPEELKQHI